MSRSEKDQGRQPEYAPPQVQLHIEAVPEKVFRPDVLPVWIFIRFEILW